MLYVVEKNGRLHHVHIVEAHSTGPEIGKYRREPLTPEVEALWRAHGITILRLPGT
jgi:hypothetical protein